MKLRLLLKTDICSKATTTPESGLHVAVTNVCKLEKFKGRALR